MDKGKATPLDTVLDIGKAKIAASNILGIRRQVRENEIQDHSTAKEKENATDAVVDFQNVSFTYPTRPEMPILKELSLQIFHGQTVGIVGTSGSGKSTLLALLERFYDVKSGGLNVFGKSILAHNIDEYRKRLSIVTQEPILYRGNLNLTFDKQSSLTNQQAQFVIIYFSASTKVKSTKKIWSKQVMQPI